MAKEWEEGGLRSIWNSLFDASEFSACKENDDDLQGVSMLVKKMFYVFEKLKGRCEEAESAQRRPCHRCASLEKVIKAYKAKLKQTESRMKSIAQILNMGGGLSQDPGASPGKQQSMAKALTQILLGDETAISEDESETESRGGAKRRRCGPITPIKVNVVAHKRSPIRVNMMAHKGSPVRGVAMAHKGSPVRVIAMAHKGSPVRVIAMAHKGSPVMGIAMAHKGSPARGIAIAPESLPTARECPERRAPANRVVLESLCSQLAAPEDVVFLSDGEETYVDPPVTPTRRDPAASGRGKSSPVIRSKTSKKTARLRLDRQLQATKSSENNARDDADLSFTSSPPLNGSKKSPFTPKPRATSDRTMAGSPGDILEAKERAIAAPKGSTSASGGGGGEGATKNSTPSDFAQTLVSTPELIGGGDDTFVSPSLLRGLDPLSKPASRPVKVATDPGGSKLGLEATDYGLVRSTGNAEVDNILDIICDTNVRTKRSASKGGEEAGPDPGVPRRQADYWRLKPSTTSKEPVSFANGHKLKQTRIAFGVHPERTDVCTLREFNGGVRQSQAGPPLRESNGGVRQSPPSLDSDLVALREFNGGVRPGQTSTMLPLEMMPEYADDAAFERAILDSLRDTNTQCVPDEEGEEEGEDFVSPSPDLSGSKRFVPSQRAKQSAGVDLKENEESPPDTEDLLDEMGAPSLPRRAADHLVRGFDRVPKRHEDVPAHKYQRDAVRKRDERMKMEGWDCADCKKYYAGRVNNSAERKQLMDRCSKHRDKYRRNDTPPGYWNPEFPSTPELRARNLDITQKAQKFRTRKRH